MDPDSEDRTPVPYFDESTGYLCLSDGKYRQVVLRFRWPFLYVMWKKGDKKIEVPISVSELFDLLSAKERQERPEE